MGRTTKSLSGGGKDKLLRALVAGEGDISSVPAERLLKRMSEIITEVRVKREAWEDLGRMPTENRTKPPRQSVTPRPEFTVPPKPEPAPVTASTFDPFAFSTLALLTKKGKSGLAATLADIGSAEHLHALAAAQHLSIDRSEMDVAKLREAIVTATEVRLKERRAAAS